MIFVCISVSLYCSLNHFCFHHHYHYYIITIISNISNIITNIIISDITNILLLISYHTSNIITSLLSVVRCSRCLFPHLFRSSARHLFLRFWRYLPTGNLSFLHLSFHLSFLPSPLTPDSLFSYNDVQASSFRIVPNCALFFSHTY